jgi:hypothetical protein
MRRLRCFALVAFSQCAVRGRSGPAKAGMRAVSLALQHRSSQATDRQFLIRRLVIAAIFAKMLARCANTLLFHPTLRPSGRFADAIGKCERQQNWSNNLQQRQQGNAFECTEHQGAFVWAVLVKSKLGLGDLSRESAFRRVFINSVWELARQSGQQLVSR